MQSSHYFTSAYKWLIPANSIDQNPSRETNSRSASEEIPFLYGLTVLYCTYQSLPMGPILSQINPVHTLMLYFFMIHFNIISLVCLDLLFIQLPDQNSVCISHLSSVCYIAQPSHIPLSYLVTSINYEAHYTDFKAEMCTIVSITLLIIIYHKW